MCSNAIVCARRYQVTRPWGSPETARVLVIGHDPRLQASGTLADYSLFADYHFRDEPTSRKGLAKYRLAEALFMCIEDLTGGRISDKELLVTNLCNQALPSPGGSRTVLLPRGEVEQGLKDVRALLVGSQIRLIFAMSQQVNYWLQVLGFYPADARFVEESTPKETGTRSDPPYYEPSRSGAFKRICGKEFMADGQYSLFPILHVKSYPLRGRFGLYEAHYAACRTGVRKVIASLSV